jgi:predicted MFS family arabinose efflux permease
MTTETPAASSRQLGRASILTFAVAGGVAVGNLYWAQPLLEVIGSDLRVDSGRAGLLVTVTQLGYAVGVLLGVPLGDVLDRRRLIPLALLANTIALLATSMASSFAALVVSLAFVGLTTISGQLLTPLASELADPERRGAVVGTVVSGLILGILVSRTVSGLIAEVFGWRAIYVVAAAMTATLAVVLRRVIPELPVRPKVAYSDLILSVFSAARRSPVVAPTLLIGASVFGVFSLFWTALTFTLSAPPFSYSPGVVGLVGLAGVVGAMTSLRVGRLHDRGQSVGATGVFLALAVVAFVVSGLGARSIVAILAGVVLLDVAVQGANVLNQTRLLSVDPASRSRLNTAFVTSNFVGGAVGSVLASSVWSVGGWAAVTGAGAVWLGLAGIVWIIGRARLSTPTL